MAQMQKPSGKRPRSGGIFPYLALFLVCVTLWGFISFLSPATTLTRAWKKTETALEKRESGVSLLLSALEKGNFLVSDGISSFTYAASLSGERSVAFLGDGYDLALSAGSETLTVNSERFLSGSRSAAASGAATALSGSAFDTAEVRGEHLSLMRALFAFADPALRQGDIAALTKQVWNDADPTLTREKKSLPYGEGTEAYSYCFAMDSAGLVRALESLKEAGKTEENRQAICAFITLFRALAGQDTDPALRESILAFSSGEGEAFSALLLLAKDEKSRLTLDFALSDGYVIAVSVTFSLGEYKGEASLFLGENIRSAAEQSAALSLAKGEENLYSLSLTHRVTENSDKAYIRELEYSVSDPGAYFGAGEGAASTGKIRYSWGKVKGDLGLRIITPENEINFRGALTEYKKGREVLFSIKRIEVNRENILGAKPFEVTLNLKGEPQSLPKGDAALFPQGEEKETLKASFLEAYRSVFGGEAVS